MAKGGGQFHFSLVWVTVGSLLPKHWENSEILEGANPRHGDH